MQSLNNENELNSKKKSDQVQTTVEMKLIPENTSRVEDAILELDIVMLIPDDLQNIDSASSLIAAATRLLRYIDFNVKDRPTSIIGNRSVVEQVSWGWHLTDKHIENFITPVARLTGVERADLIIGKDLPEDLKNKFRRS